MDSLVSRLIATLDKRVLLTYLRQMREQSRNRVEIDVVSGLIRQIESGRFDG